MTRPDTHETVSHTRADCPAQPRLGIVIGDRICIQCHYNLVGQSIVREPHYGLPIVRCPECGTVAALQEYPLLGRWASRWGVVLAAFWLIIVLAAFLALPGLMLGFTYGLTQIATIPMVEFLGEAQDEWVRQTNFDPAPTSGFGYQPGSHYWHSVVLDEWWDQVEMAALMAEFDIVHRVLNPAMIMGWLWVSVFMTLFSLPISLLLPHVRRRWLPLAAVALTMIAALYWTVGVLMSAESTPMGLRHLGGIAEQYVGRYAWIALIVSMVIPLTIGLLLGRSVARFMVRALLPPRLRSALAGLWLTDGLDPPRPARTVHVTRRPRPADAQPQGE